MTYDELDLVLLARAVDADRALAEALHQMASISTYQPLASPRLAAVMRQAAATVPPATPRVSPEARTRSRTGPIRPRGLRALPALAGGGWLTKTLLGAGAVALAGSAGVSTVNGVLPSSPLTPASTLTPAPPAGTRTHHRAQRKSPASPEDR